MLGAELGFGRINRHAADRILHLLPILEVPLMFMVTMMVMGRILGSAHITILRFDPSGVSLPTVARSTPEAQYVVTRSTSLADLPWGGKSVENPVVWSFSMGRRVLALFAALLAAGAPELGRQNTR